MLEPEVSEILKQNTDKASKFICAILVYESTERNAAKWLTGGTCTLVRTPDAQYLLTANHVVQEIETLKLSHSLVVFIAGTGEPIDITDWPTIDSDSLIDLHTINVPDEFDPASIKKEYLEIAQWPLQRAKVGDSAFVIGYPAANRRGRHSSVGLRITPISDFVTDIGPRKFTMADETDEREIVLNPDNLLLPQHFGGMSGAPAFCALDGKQAKLIGVFCGGGDGLRGAYFLCHTDFLLSDGRLDRLRIPPM